MDLEDEDWVNVDYDGLLEVHDDDDEGENILSRKYAKSNPNTSQDHVEDEPMREKQADDKEEGIKSLIMDDTSFEHGLEVEPERGSDSNQDPIFNVFFKKENQFVEMKMDSSRLSSQESDLSRIETTTAFQHDEKLGDHVVNCSSPSKNIKKEVVDWKESNQILNFWKWGLSGIGVLCCVGMTAATICVIMCGNGKRHKQQNQKLRIQIYTDNKRVKQVMLKANEAMSAVRGVPLVKAQITFGGHYECL